MDKAKNFNQINPRNQFEAQLKTILQQHRTQLLEKPQELTRLIPKRQKDSKQQFYRQIQPSNSENLVFKLGWKIANLTPQQVDITLFCLALLQSKLKFPIKTYLRQEHAGQNGYNSLREELWIQACVMGYQSDGMELQSRIQKQVLDFCGIEMVPRLKRFISEQINWSKIMQKNFEDSIVVNKFDKQVIQQLNYQISKYQFIK